MSTMGDYLRNQAAKCTVWSRECFDLGTARRLRLMAEEFRAKANEIDASPEQDAEADFGYAPSAADSSSLQA